jgi:uncharacterized damage-inducible protein DinB
MGAGEPMSRMLRYQAWANQELLNGIAELDAGRFPDERGATLRLMNHCLVVGRIFSAHLLGEAHGFASDNTRETPALDALRAALATLDDWYLDYASRVTADALSQAVAFRFTDGDDGCMTREEMLTHVVLHGTYHRGEVGRILTQASARADTAMRLPWDTYAVHLHRGEPARRQGRTTA